MYACVQYVHVNAVYLLNDAVLNVDIRFLGEVIIDHLPSLDEDTHRPHVGSHNPARGTKKTFNIKVTLTQSSSSIQAASCGEKTGK